MYRGTVVYWGLYWVLSGLLLYKSLHIGISSQLTSTITTITIIVGKSMHSYKDGESCQL